MAFMLCAPQGANAVLEKSESAQNTSIDPQLEHLLNPDFTKNKAKKKL